MRISDWSSDVCSSDLVAIVGEMRAEQRELEVRLHPGRARLLGLFQRPRPAQQPMRVETVSHPETGSAVEGEAQFRGSRRHLAAVGAALFCADAIFELRLALRILDLGRNVGAALNRMPQT